MTTETSPFHLQGRVALVTGGGRGLGLAIATGLAQAGARVFLNGREPERTAAAAAAADAGSGRIRPLAFDVAEPAAAAAAVAGLLESAGRLDVLVNNVGQRDRRPLDDFALDDVRRLLDVNLVAPFELARLAAARMEAGGSIINVTSIAGPIANRGDAVYTMSKGGLAALTRALAADLGPRGIRVNGIAPGFFATEQNAAMVADEDIEDWLRRRTSLGRWGAPSEIAGAAVFLAAPASSYVTGHVLAVDGGYLAHF